MRSGLYGSGKGNSFDSDLMRCPRFGYWLHQEGVRLREQGDGAALVVGSAGHAWMEAFHSSGEASGFTFEQCVIDADERFAEVLNEASVEAQGLGYELLTLEQRADTALTLLHTLAPQFARRTLEGGESTVRTEMHGTLQLPSEFWPHNTAKFEMQPDGKYQLGPGVLMPKQISEPLRNFTVAIDRVFYHPGAGPLDSEDIPRQAGLAIDEYKFTSAMSPQQYAEEHLLNDQSLGYLYWLRESIRAPGGMSSDARVLGVRYRVFRVSSSITAKSYAEVWETVNDAKLDDWYRRKVAFRGRLAEKWGKGMDEWDASRYAFGPCRRFGRECAYWALCDEPGTERAKIGGMEDVGSLYVRMPPTEYEMEKP